MVPGDRGENGPSVPGAVVEELRPGGDAVPDPLRADIRGPGGTTTERVTAHGSYSELDFKLPYKIK